MKDTTTAAFRQDVIAESMQQPVLVDFWAPWCGPCKQLTPILEKAVRAAGGKVKLVKMNIDEHPQIAGQLGVQSIPAVFAFQRGQPVDGFMGALPESQVKSFIERLVGPARAQRRRRAHGGGRRARGGRATSAAPPSSTPPSWRRIPRTVGALAALVKLHVDLGDLEGAKRFLAMAPDSQGRTTPRSRAPAPPSTSPSRRRRSATSPTSQRQVEADPLDHQARFDLALGLNARGQAPGSRRPPP